MDELAAALEPPKDGLAACVVHPDRDGPLLRMRDGFFPRPCVLQRCCYRKHADDFLDDARFLKPVA
ncbi:hypothetical protein F6B41_23755 [Microbacterium lushaniae]|nr:hypothetical protein F6B41_23755 [Microbacterium lushaniae]